MAPKRHSNKLINETSPYLLQHAHNPVDWHPWGREALEVAKRLGKPIFLSIGYSACHWCHVMEKESFEDEDTAKVMNQFFINIKVDREERQDIDHIYMSAVQIMTQHGGWPLSVFLTPDLKPFYGGTYFPPEDRYGMPSFKKVLLGVAAAWKDKRDSVLESAETLTNALKDLRHTSTQNTPPSMALLENAVQSLKSNFDSKYGGVGTAPKFFHTMDFKIALRAWKMQKDGCLMEMEMVTKTLDSWAMGGIRDHLGGGFHRYSTDARWLVPHFEKMLYDNALVTDLFLEGFQATGNHEYAATAHHTLDFVVSEMQSPEGGFYSTFDADSEGIEGKYYVWSRKEIQTILPGDVSSVFENVYSVTEEGNWEGHNILERTKSWEALAEAHGLSIESLEDLLSMARRKLLTHRKNRIAPSRDDKILTNWNSLMIDTLARASQILDEPRYYESSAKAARFVLSSVFKQESDILYHCYKDGECKYEGFLDDYSCFILALLSLYETDFDPYWIENAEKLAEKMEERFFDKNERILYFTEKNAPHLIVRPVEAYDGATPSASAMATTALVRLYHFTGKRRYAQTAEMVLKQYRPLMETAPSGAGQFLLALDLLVNDPIHFVLAKGEESFNFEGFLKKIRQSFLPQKNVLLINSKFDSPHFTGREPVAGKTALYICKGQTCLPPILSPDELDSALSRL